ncbi:MAG: tetratricopeptide repeat protein, partial [Thermodesulfobacteriota bacterium]
MRKSILFFDVHAHHVPIMQAVGRQGFFPITNSAALAQAVRQEGLLCGEWGAFMSPQIQTKAQQQVNRLIAGLKERSTTPSLCQAFASPLGNFLNVTGQGFFQKMVEMLANQITILETFEGLTQQHDLRLIVLGADALHCERVLVNYAATCQITTLLLAQGLICKTLAKTAGEMSTLFSDFVAAFGQRDRLAEMGNSPERIFLTGAPAWDEFYLGKARLSKTEARRHLGLRPEWPVVLFCATYAEGSTAFCPALTRQMLAVHQALAEVMRNLGDQAQLIVRPHPNEYLRMPRAVEDEKWLAEAYGKWARQAGISRLYLSRSQKLQAIRAADVVIVNSESSVVPEVMILERPVILIPFHELRLYTEQDGMVIADDLSLLPQIVLDLLANPAKQHSIIQRQNAALPLMNFGHDGRATERVTRLVVELANRPYKGASIPSPHPQPSNPGQQSSRTPAVVRKPSSASEEDKGKGYHQSKTIKQQIHADDNYKNIKPLIDSDKHEEAIYALERFLESHPDYGLAHNDLGVLYYKKGEKKKAISQYEKAVSLNPRNATFLKNLADFYYVELKRIDEATDLYEKILSISPTDVETLLILGNIHVELGKFSNAKAHYLKVLEIDPANELASKMLEALKERECEQAGVDPEEAYQEVQSLIQSGNRDEAIERLEEFLEVYPKYAQAHNDLGNLYYIMGNMEKALPRLEKAVLLKPDNIKFLKTLADFYLAEVGNVEEALKVYNHVLVLQPSDIETLLMLGNICAAQRQFRDAKFFFLRVLDLEPQNLHAHENLDALSKLEREESTAAQAEKFCDVAQLPFNSGEQQVVMETNHSNENHREASVIIPVFNQKEYTARCLEVLYKNTSLEEICEVIVINNGSTDDTENYLEQAVNLYPRLSILSNKENLKFARACNQGARVAKGKYLVFLNNDTEPLPGWLSLGLKRIKSDDKIGVVGSKLLYPDRRIQHCGIEFMRGINPSHTIWPEHRLRYASEDDPRVNSPEEVHAVTGACL